MILQALVQHYEDLAARGCVGRPGWGPVKVSFALYIDEQGNLVRVSIVQETQTRGKKTVMIPNHAVARTGQTLLGNRRQLSLR